MIIDIIAGARPNFMKIAPIIEAIECEKRRDRKIDYRLVHTGQHYDENMSGSFFEELKIPKPHINLGCGGGTQATQTANIMVKYEKEVIENRPDLVLVVGDVTSTMACSIVAKKLCIKVAHVEAGIRSFDLTMPEEINRMVTDSIADYFFTTTLLANQNLKMHGASDEQIFLVGNVMIDTLLKNISRLTQPPVWEKIGLQARKYFVITLHRPANVDQEGKLKKLMGEIVQNVQDLPVIFPVHPRTAKILTGLEIEAPNLQVIAPLGYLEFNYLVKNAKAVITDSGGITEETTVLGIPCLTLRDNTERPETVSIGTNELIGTDPNAIKLALEKLFAGKWKKGNIPDLWDGNSASRIVENLCTVFKV